MSRQPLEITFDTSDLIRALADLPDNGKKALGPWLKKGAALVVSSSGTWKGMVQALPPFALNEKANAHKAKSYGEKKTAAQIWRVYGGPRQAYTRILNAAGIGAAKGFWGALKRNDIAKASDILQRHVGRRLQPFDDGIEHEKRRNGRGQVKDKYPTFYTSRKQWIAAYVKEKQRLVGLLGSVLLRPGLKEFGSFRGVPSFVDRHRISGGNIDKHSDHEGEYYHFSISVGYNVDFDRLLTSVVSYRLQAMYAELPSVIRAARLLP